MNKVIRIGSRDSKLAKWQAEEVQRLLTENGYQTEIIYKKSIGDLVQDKPLHALGTVGVFTKVLDEALLNNEIDIAVHSCKDLPSVLPQGLQLCAFLEREENHDVIVGYKEINFLNNPDFDGVIATGSVRRKAQLLAKFPKATVVGLRGNVPTRLQKLKDNNWDGAVFAYAGLKRLGIEPEFYAKADFMVSAPAQGVVAIACRTSDTDIIEACKTINHEQTELTTTIERDFLRMMEGGCISPIGGAVKVIGNTLEMTVSVLATDGTEKVEFTKSVEMTQAGHLAGLMYNQAKHMGAMKIIYNIETNENA